MGFESFAHNALNPQNNFLACALRAYAIQLALGLTNCKVFLIADLGGRIRRIVAELAEPSAKEPRCAYETS